MELQFGEYDCENSRDFHQYYRGRYFARKEGTKLIPLAYYTVMEDEKIACYEYSKEADATKLVQLTYDQLKASCVFGHPVLGNINFGPTCCYLTAYPKRESAKGINIRMLGMNWPEHGGFGGTYGSSIFAAYCNKYPDFRNIAMGNSGFRNVEEFRALYQLYNREFRKVAVAVDELERGDRIGCAVSHKLGLFVSGHYDRIQVMYRGKHAGELVEGYYNNFTVRPNPEHAYLEQSINEVLNRWQP